MRQIAAKMRGASQIAHESSRRRQNGLESGATAVAVAERGEEGIAKVREILGWRGQMQFGMLEQLLLIKPRVLHNGTFGLCQC